MENHLHRQPEAIRIWSSTTSRQLLTSFFFLPFFFLPFFFFWFSSIVRFHARLLCRSRACARVERISDESPDVIGAVALWQPGQPKIRRRVITFALLVCVRRVSHPARARAYKRQNVENFDYPSRIVISTRIRNFCNQPRARCANRFYASPRRASLATFCSLGYADPRRVSAESLVGDYCFGLSSHP